MLSVTTHHLPADILGLSPLAARALSRGPAFGHIPVVRSIADLSLPPDRLDVGERGLLVQGIQKELARHEPPAATRRALASLERPGTFAVITGQQPGLLASPLYSLYKALQSIRLARELQERLETPVVALFWNHADDHDVAEVHHAWQLNANLDLQKLGLAGMSSGRTPIGEIVLDDEHHRLNALRANLRQLYGDHAHIEEALELFLPREGETLARALTRSFTELLGPQGLIVVEPEWIRPELSRALAHVVGRDPVQALEQAADALRRDGLEPVIDARTAALVFQHGERGREAHRSGGEGFVHEREPGSRTPAELSAAIVATPSRWSAGALLRPIVQDLVLPTIAYVGGLGELAYHAQLGPLRDRSWAPHTPFVPRASCTLVEPATRESLATLGIDVRDVLAARGRYDVEDEDDAPPVLSELRAIASRAARELLACREALSELDRGLAMNLKRTADQVRDTVEKIAVKGDRVHANSSGKGRRHVRRVNNALFPRETPQERVLGPLSFYARHGPQLIRALAAELPAVGCEHLVLDIDPGPEANVNPEDSR